MDSYNKYHNGQNGFSNHSNGSNSVNNYESNTSAEEDIDWKKAFYILWNRKWIIGGAILICGLLAGIYAFTRMPIYQSHGMMIIKNSQGSGALSEGGIGSLLSSTFGLGSGSTFENEMQVLKSRRLSEMVADSLLEIRIMPNGLPFPVLYKSYPENSAIVSQDTVAARIREHINFRRVEPKANVVSIAYESPSPYEAARIVNLTMNLYQVLSTRQTRKAAHSAVVFLKKERKRIKENLDQAEKRLREFMNKSNLVQVDAQTKVLIEQMAALEAKRQQARAKLVAVNAALNQYEKRLNSIKPGLAEQYAKAIGPKIKKLQFAKSELEVRKIKLLTKNPQLTQESPQITEIERKIDSYESRIEEYTQNLIEKSDQYLGFLGGAEAGIAEGISKLNQKLIELQVQKAQLESQIDIISAQLEEQERFFRNLPDNIIRLAQLKRDLKISEELFVTVSKQYAETALWEQTQFGKGRIIDLAFIPKVPVEPRKKLIILIGLVIGGLSSIGYVLTRDAFDTTIDGVEKMRKLPVPLISVVPSMTEHIKEHNNGAKKVRVNGSKLSTDLITILDSISPISESFRRLQNNLIYSNPDTNLKSIMVTSSGKGEGKTTTIANLGVVLSEAGFETLIVDTDFRRPNLHNMFGDKKTPGIVDVLFDDTTLREAVQETVSPELSILTSGRRPPNAAAITQSRAFLEMIHNLKKHYDFLLIDTPPIGIITDAAAMIRQTDALVVVAKFGETTEVQLKQTLNELRHLNANVMGTVLTSFDHTKSTDYYLNSKYYKEVYKDYDTYKEGDKV